MPAPFEIQDLDGTLDPNAWTAIVAPDNWDALVISNSNGGAALTLKAASGADTVAIAIGASQALSPPPPRQNARHTAAGVNYRFGKGAVMGYLQPASGTGAGMFLLWA